MKAQLSFLLFILGHEDGTGIIPAGRVYKITKDDIDMNEKMKPGDIVETFNVLYGATRNIVINKIIDGDVKKVIGKELIEIFSDFFINRNNEYEFFESDDFHSWINKIGSDCWKIEQYTFDDDNEIETEEISILSDDERDELYKTIESNCQKE